MRWNVFKFIDINGIKHAAEYLNSSKVKYDDDVIDTPPLVRRREALNNDGTSRRRRGWTLFDDGPSYRIQINEDIQNLLFVSPSSSIELLVLERPFVFSPFGSVKTLERI